MRKINRFSLFGSLCSFLLAGSLCTDAAQIFDNGSPDLLNGFEMVIGSRPTNLLLTTGATIQNVKFWDLERVGYFQSTIPWAIYSNTGNNKPGTLIASGFSSNLTHTLTGETTGSVTSNLSVRLISRPLLCRRGTYWLALHNGPLSYLIQQVYWETAVHSSTIPSQSDITPFLGVWVANFGLTNPAPKLAFQLNGTRR